MLNNKKIKIVTALAVTPIHVGVGQEFGAVDLPVQRDTLNYPVIYASSFKGALKQECARVKGEIQEIERQNHKINRVRDESLCAKLFGSDVDPEKGISSFSVSDLRLLFIPARSAINGAIYLTTIYMIDSVLEYLNMAKGQSSFIDHLIEELNQLKEDTAQGQQTKVDVMGIQNVPLRNPGNFLASLFCE